MTFIIFITVINWSTLLCYNLQSLYQPIHKSLLPSTCPSHLPAAYRVVLAVLAQDLWGDPALGAWHAGAPAEAVPACRQLLAEAKVGNHGAHAPVGVGHGHQDVVRL